MTNPQDIDKAFGTEFPQARLFEMGWSPGDHRRLLDFYRTGWAAALRAVQEPADADAFLADADKAFYEICTPEWYVSHSLGFGVKAAFLEGANWAAAATPPPPGAASPGVPAQSPKPRLRLTGNQVLELNEFMGGDYGCEIVLGTLPARKSTEGEDMPAGVYVWIGEHPEEGCVLLSPEAEAASPAGPAGHMVAACCGRPECGGECGNEWQGMHLPQPYRCIKPHCPPECSGCNYAISGEPGARMLIVRLLDEFANDGHGATFEDGDHPLVDEARAFLFVEALTAAPQPPPLPAGWVAVPVEPTRAMIVAGGHANSEWLNDNAPLGEARYQEPAASAYRAMLAAATPLPKEKLVSVQTSEPDEPDEAICSACHGTGIEGIDRGERSMPRCEYCGGGGSIRLARQEKP